MTVIKKSTIGALLFRAHVLEAHVLEAHLRNRAKPLNRDDRLPISPRQNSERNTSVKKWRDRKQRGEKQQTDLNSNLSKMRDKNFLMFTGLSPCPFFFDGEPRGEHDCYVTNLQGNGRLLPSPPPCLPAHGISPPPRTSLDREHRTRAEQACRWLSPAIHRLLGGATMPAGPLATDFHSVMEEEKKALDPTKGWSRRMFKRTTSSGSRHPNWPQ